MRICCSLSKSAESARVRLMKKRTLFFLTYTSVLVFFVILMGLIFIPAGDWSFALGWLFWLSFCAPTLLITAYFLRVNPALIERRILPRESRPKQIAGQSIAGILFGALIAVPSAGYRLGWTAVPAGLSVLADICIVTGFAVVFAVFRENTFASRAIELMSEQKVIKTGLYSKVRHPMYSGAVLIILATPFALGSWAGLAVAPVLVGVVIFRILDEEKLLADGLKGYRQYCEETKYRLIPYIW